MSEGHQQSDADRGKKLFNDAVVVVVQLLLLLWVKPPVFVELIEFVVSCLVLAIKRNVF